MNSHERYHPRPKRRKSIHIREGYYTPKNLGHSYLGHISRCKGNVVTTISALKRRLLPDGTGSAYNIAFLPGVRSHRPKLLPFRVLNKMKSSLASNAPRRFALLLPMLFLSAAAQHRTNWGTVAAATSRLRLTGAAAFQTAPRTRSSQTVRAAHRASLISG